MKLTEFELDGKIYHLLLNGTALFNVYDKFGYEKDVLELIAGDSREAHNAAVWIASELSLQGELYRRLNGEDKGEILRPAQAAVMVQPSDMPALRQALSQAIRQGFLREHPDRDEVDVYLQEINATQKKTTQSLVRSILGSLQKALDLRSGRV